MLPYIHIWSRIYNNGNLDSLDNVSVEVTIEFRYFSYLTIHFNYLVYTEVWIEVRYFTHDLFATNLSTEVHICINLFVYKNMQFNNLIIIKLCQHVGLITSAVLQPLDVLKRCLDVSDSPLISWDSPWVCWGNTRCMFLSGPRYVFWPGPWSSWIVIILDMMLNISQVVEVFISTHTRRSVFLLYIVNMSTLRCQRASYLISYTSLPIMWSLLVNNKRLY